MSGFVNVNSSDTRLINFTEEVDTTKEEKEETAPETKNIVTMDLNQALKEKERMLRDEEANLKVKYQQVMEDANKKAEDIIAEANEKAKDILETSAKQGQEEGHKLGLSQGQEEIEQIKEQLYKQERELEEKYNDMADKFESDFIDIFANIFEKISGTFTSVIGKSSFTIVSFVSSIANACKLAMLILAAKINANPFL